jgi:kynurenine formamidase
MIDLTPRLVEGMAINHPHHPRAPLVLVNQRFEFIRLFYRDFWMKTGSPPAFDGLPADWTDPESARGWQNEELLLHSHLGAHVDAPLHFNPESGWDAAAIPVDQCWGSAVVLDFRHLGEEPFAITIADLEDAERRAGVIVGNDDIVLIHSGWMARWGHDREHYGQIPNPGLHHSTPQWFIERGVKMVGSDVGNIDFDMTSSCHVNFLCREAIGKRPILIAENIANLERIPTPRFTFVALPLPIEGASGSPVRATAIVD